VELYLHSPMRLHGVVLSQAQDTSSGSDIWLSTGTTLPLQLVFGQTSETGTSQIRSKSGNHYTTMFSGSHRHYKQGRTINLNSKLKLQLSFSHLPAVSLTCHFTERMGSCLRQVQGRHVHSFERYACFSWAVIYAFIQFFFFIFIL